MYEVTRCQLFYCWFFLFSIYSFNNISKTRWFNSVTIKQVKISIKCQSSTVSFWSFVCKFTVLKQKEITAIRQYLRKSLNIIYFCLIFWHGSIYKYTRLRRMGMYIQKHFEVFCLHWRKFLFKLLADDLNFKGSVSISLTILISKEMTIHVFSLKIISVITGYDTIWINKRNYPSFILISKFMGKYVFW